jgi:hypothetical protein
MSRIVIGLVIIALLAACAPVGVGTTTPVTSAVPNGVATALPTRQATTSPSSAATSSPTEVVTTTPDAGIDSSQPGTANPYQPLENDTLLKRGNVFIDSSQIIVLESFPPQFRMAIKGSLPTPCHQLRLSVGHPDANNRVDIEAYSVYDPEAVCIQVLKEFDAVLSLDGLATGKYSIWLNGQSVGEIDVPAPLEGKSMKGWEIYSWQVDGVWYYALLVGTNRNKTLEEVQDPAVRLASLEVLKERLAGLAEGEWVTWLVLDYGGLELPPQTVLDEVRAWAEGHGLNFQTAVN